jgi:predicted Na+-dependent transporter
MATKESLLTRINKAYTIFIPNNNYSNNFFKKWTNWHNVISVIVILILLFLVALPFWIYFGYVQEKITNKNYDIGIIAALCVNVIIVLPLLTGYYINRKIKPKEEKKRQPKPRI